MALASEFAELERERLEITSRGQCQRGSTRAPPSPNAAARADLAQAERKLADAEAEAERTEAACVAAQRKIQRA